jgi:DNA polymerase III gamma/tau subunit
MVHIKASLTLYYIYAILYAGGLTMNNGFYNRYRPKSLDGFIGNAAAVKAIKKLSKSPPPALLITGATGLGKTTLCRIYASTILNTKNLLTSESYIEKNVGAERGIATIRELLDTMQYKPFDNSGKRIIVLDEIHKQTTDALSALFKPLEEPPEGNIWVLITNYPNALPKEILGRCVRVDLQPLSDDELRSVLKPIVKKENIEISEKQLKTLIRNSRGEPRRAITLLEGVSYYKNITDGTLQKEADKLAPIDDTACRMLYCLYSKSYKQLLLLIFNNKYDLDELLHCMITNNRLLLQSLAGIEIADSNINKIKKEMKHDVEYSIKLHLNLKSLKATYPNPNDYEVLLQLWQP